MNYFPTPVSQHAPGLTSLGFVYKNADGMTRMYEARNVTGREEAERRMPAFVKNNLVQPVQCYTLPHIP